MKRHLKAAFAVLLAALMALTAFPAFAVKNSSESEATVSTDKENIFVAKAPNPNEHTNIAPIQPLTQSRYYNFNTNYTLTGNGASDMVAIALAQVGMTGSQLGYSEQWCADFIGDCAILAGETAAIPLYGGVPGLRERIETAGGYYVSVSNAQPGDVCIIDWDGGGHNNHVELVYSANGSSISTVGGNSGDYSSLYTRRVVKHNPLNSGVITCIIRPNYTSSPIAPPTFATVSTDKASYAINETVTFNIDSDGVTNTLWIYLPDGSSTYYQDVGMSYQLAFGWQGRYEALVQTWNGQGSFCSERISFSIGAPTFASVSMDKTSYAINETVTFSIDSDGVTNTLWLYLPDGSSTYYQDVGMFYQLAFGWQGRYEALVQTWNGQGSFISERISFSIGSPTFATVSTDKASYAINETVTFNIDSDGVTNTLWLYLPDGSSTYYQDVGMSYQLAFGWQGRYEALVQTWNGQGSYVSERVSFYVGFIPGDIDCDGNIFMTDALTALRMAMSILPISNLEAADMDGNGTITVADALRVMRIAMGLA